MMVESMLKGLMMDLRGDAASMLRKIVTNPHADNGDMVHDCMQVCRAMEAAEKAVKVAYIKAERSMSIINNMQ